MRAFYLGWEIRQTPSAKFEACAKRPPQQPRRPNHAPPRRLSPTPRPWPPPFRCPGPTTCDSWR
jgi:hypothetical protein